MRNRMGKKPISHVKVQQVITMKRERGINHMTSKHIYKVLTVSALTTIIACSSIGSTSTFAAESSTIASVTTTDQYKGAISVINQYANTMVEQTHLIQTRLDQIKAVDSKTKDLVQQYQNTAKTNANQWLTELQPNINQLSKNLTYSSSVFQSYSKALQITAKKGKVDTCKVLGKLIPRIETDKNSIETQLKELNTFQTNLQTDIDHLAAIIPSQKAYLQNVKDAFPDDARDSYQMFEKRLTRVLNEDEKKYYDSILSQENLFDLKKHEKIHDEFVPILQKKVTDIQAFLDKVTNTHNSIQKGIQSVQSISNQLSQLDSKYTDLLKQSKSMHPENIADINEALGIIQKNLQDIRSEISTFSGN